MIENSLSRPVANSNETEGISKDFVELVSFEAFNSLPKNYRCKFVQRDGIVFLGPYEKAHRAILQNAGYSDSFVDNAGIFIKDGENEATFTGFSGGLTDRATRADSAQFTESEQVAKHKQTIAELKVKIPEVNFKAV